MNIQTIMFDPSARLFLASAILFLCFLGACFWASSAFGAPSASWQLTLIPLPTNLQSGSTGNTENGPMLRLVATNIGTTSTSADVTFEVTLPAGIKPIGFEGDSGDPGLPDPSCGIGIDEQVVTCTTSGSVRPSRWLGARIPVEVNAASGALPPATALIESTGTTSITTSAPITVGPTPPPFGFLPGPAGLSGVFTNIDGSPSVRAGSHPDQLTINLTFPTKRELPLNNLVAAGHLRDVVVDLPRGVMVNPTATPVRCTEAEFLSSEGSEPGCPAASQVGVIHTMTQVAGPNVAIGNIYNMVPPPGEPATIAFEPIAGIFVHLKGGVRSDGDYGLSAEANDILARTNNPVLMVRTQLWGDPSSSSHDSARGVCRGEAASLCPVTPQDKPFLTMPSACSGPVETKVRVDSWEEPGVFHERTTESTDIQGNPVDVNGCSSLEFKPTLTLQPDVNIAGTPTGVRADLEVPQNEGKNELATSNLKDTVVTFPAGLALNPAAAAGLTACTPSQIGLKTGIKQEPIRFSSERPQCPGNAKIGSVEVDTPLLDHPLPGSVYVAQPYQNPFGTLLGVYIVVDEPADGIVVKLAGKTEIIDQKTGQLRTTFEENPEVPVEHFTVDLFGGPRAALRTPTTCGSFTTTSVETPWSGTAPVSTVDSFTIKQGANGKPCSASEAEMPNAPDFNAGTATPIAGTFSPFLGRLQREDGEQLFKSLNLKLPPGLSGKLAGVQTCDGAAIDAAAGKTGIEEQQSPSCPAASQVGEVSVGAGAGPQPYYTTAKIYLAGPYGDGPVSAVIITPAVAGPFDLGTVVTRAALYIDPATARITVKSDPIPPQLQGIQLQVRDVQVNMARPDFTLNPTSCDPMSISAEAISVLNQIASLAERFQVGGCKGLDYEPKLAIRLFGKTGRGAHPRLRAVLQAKFGEANTARASVALPRSEFLENAHIGTVCTRVQFAADACPAKSIYGKARAITPLLDEPLEGPVYLRSSSHKLPDMVAALKGPPSRPIKIELAGRIDSVNGGIRSTFELVPDQPVTKFILEMKGGAKGLLVNSRNLCAHTYRATAKFTGQSGKAHDFNPVMSNSCKKDKKTSKRDRR